MFVARSQKHTSVEFCFGARGENPPAQVPSLRDACLPPTHSHPHHASDSTMAQTEQRFWQQGMLKAAARSV